MWGSVFCLKSVRAAGIHIKNKLMLAGHCDGFVCLEQQQSLCSWSITMLMKTDGCLAAGTCSLINNMPRFRKSVIIRYNMLFSTHGLSHELKSSVTLYWDGRQYTYIWTITAKNGLHAPYMSSVSTRLSLDGSVGDPGGRWRLASGGGALFCGGGDRGGHPELSQVCSQSLCCGKKTWPSSIHRSVWCI